jgi:hypothetical protein
MNYAKSVVVSALIAYVAETRRMGANKAREQG